ncbi:MAG: UbiA-like polyprenyltransferase [Syntrophotaleaceae bacterium]
MQNALYRKTRTVLEMIKFSHTVFAFPFALTGVLLVVLEEGAWPSWGRLGWICAALVGARSGAMAINRLIDIQIDRDNPRTANRHLPSGQVTAPEAWLLVVLSFSLLMLAAWQLNPLCFFLSPILIGLFILYPFCKRFTAGSHLILGLCLAAAPVGAWIALRGNLDWPPLVLGTAVLVWVAGFDILYALQDEDFDRSYGLYSIPARFGAANALVMARLLHLAMVLLLLLLGFISPFGIVYLAGVGVVGGLLLYEHRLIRADDLSRLDTAFFAMNGYISLCFFTFSLLDVLVGR